LPRDSATAITASVGGGFFSGAYYLQGLDAKDGYRAQSVEFTSTNRRFLRCQLSPRPCFFTWRPDRAGAASVPAYPFNFDISTAAIVNCADIPPVV
jgi:hypothetical protein